MTEFVPVPDSTAIAHFLEESAVVDWQTPRVFEQARALAAPCEEDAERVQRAFAFVRDEIATPDSDASPVACSAGQVLRQGAALSFARSHLLAALLRAVGLPAGFLYQRVRSGDQQPRLVLYGLAAVRLEERWVPLDAGGDSPLEGSRRIELDPAAPELSHPRGSEHGEVLLPTLFSKPSRRVLDLLQRTPDVAAVLAHRPDAP